MATMHLRDVIKCKCGKDMFVSGLNKENKTIDYTCMDECCGNTMKLGFEDAILPENEKFKYFCLNDDGQMTWRCFNHGYCDFDVEWFGYDWQNKVNKFVEHDCALEKSIDEIDEIIALFSHFSRDEIEEMFGNSGGGIEAIMALFSHLEEDQIQMIADEMGVMAEDDLYSAFMEEFENGLIEGYVDSWEEFKEQIINTMYYLNLCLDEDDE